MALDDSAYGTVAKVRSYLTGIVVGDSEGEEFINDTANVLNNHLQIHGYIVPVVEADSPYAFRTLAKANCEGAAALKLASLASEPYEEPTGRFTLTRRGYFESQFAKCLQLIEKRLLSAPTEDGGIRREIIIGSAEREGLRSKSLFTKDLFDYPGSRTLSDA